MITRERSEIEAAYIIMQMIAAYVSVTIGV